jgi:hypothetical protein
VMVNLGGEEGRAQVVTQCMLFATCDRLSIGYAPVGMRGWSCAPLWHHTG